MDFLMSAPQQSFPGGGGVTPWHLAAGVTPTIAYQAAGAPSFAASKINLANPGTLNAIDGTAAPAWDAVNGWTFGTVAAGGFLNTGYIPTTINSTMIVRVWNGGAVASGQTYAALAGYSAGAAPAQTIQPNDNGGCSIANGGLAGLGSLYRWLTSGIMGFAGNKTYLMGSPTPTNVPAGTNLSGFPLYIGAADFNNSASQFFGGSILAVWIADGVILSDAQMFTQMEAMRALLPADVAQNNLRTTYLTNKFGALIDWNTPTFTGVEVSNGNLAPNTVWAPTGMNINQWMSGLVAAGIKYAYLTTKHHDGFALWPTAQAVATFAPYSIAQTTWYTNNGSPDIVGQFVAACRANGIKPGIYFSIWDKTFELRSGTTSTSNPAGYTAMVKAQLTELLTNYGQIHALWTDGWGWQLDYAGVKWEDIYAHVKGLQPNCLIIENAHEHPAPRSQIETYEIPVGADGVIPAGNIRLSEAVDTILNTGNWFWHSVSDVPKATATLQASITTTLSRNSNYMLGIAINQAGVIPSDQLAVLTALHP